MQSAVASCPSGEFQCVGLGKLWEVCVIPRQKDSLRKAWRITHGWTIARLLASQQRTHTRPKLEEGKEVEAKKEEEEEENWQGSGAPIAFVLSPRT